MRQYKSEQDVLNELNIPDWRHMSKDKIMAFASQIPNMSPEVAKAAIAQFPEFVKLSTELVNAMMSSLNTVAENAKAIDLEVLNQDKNILDVLLQQIPLANNSEEKAVLIDAIVKVSDSMHDLAEKHHKFLLDSLQTVMKGLLGVAASAAVVIGGVKAYNSISDKHSEDNEE